MLISAPFNSFILSFVDVKETVADGGEVGTQRSRLVPAVTHQLNQLNVVGRVVWWDRRSERWRLTATHTHEYICLHIQPHKAVILFNRHLTLILGRFYLLLLPELSDSFKHGTKLAGVQKIDPCRGLLLLTLQFFMTSLLICTYYIVFVHES